MAALGQLVVSLSANIAQFQQSMDKASYLAEKNFNKIQSAAKTAAAAVTGYLALNQVKDAIKAQLDYADQLAKTSQKVGVSTETLSAYAYAAELAGVNFEQLQKSLIFLSKGSVDAARGIGESKDAFDAMGISVKNTDGTVKSNSQLLEEVADKFATYKDSAEKTALAVKIFGKAGADMIPLLNGGRDAIREAKEEAEKFGIIIGGDFAKRAEAVNDNFTRIKKAGEGLSLLLAENLLPKLEKITTAMVQAAKEGGVLKAVLVGIGGVMFESFSDSKTQQINKLNTYLEQAQESWKIFKEQADMTGMTPKLDQQLLKIESRIKTLKEQIDALNKQDVKPKKGEEEKEGKAPGMADPAALKKALEDARKAIFNDSIPNLSSSVFTLDIKEYGCIPVVEQILFLNHQPGIYNFPLFLEDCENTQSTFTDVYALEGGQGYFHYNSYKSVLNWWKSIGCKLTIKSIMQGRMNHIYDQPQFGENWFSYPNLYKKMVEKFPSGSKFVEIGSWKGKSSAYMAVEIANSYKNIEFSCVDTWEGSIEHQDRNDLDSLYNTFIENMKPLEKYYSSLRMASLDAVNRFEDDSLDFVFIDASHEYEDVKNDIIHWMPKLKETGIIGGDDYGNRYFPGVKKAVEEIFNNNFKYKEATWYYSKNLNFEI